MTYGEIARPWTGRVSGAGLPRMPRGEPKAGSVVTSITYPKEFFDKVNGLLTELKRRRQVPQTLRFNDFVMRLAEAEAERLRAD